MKKNNEQLKIMVPIILVAVILTIGIVRYITGMQRAIWQQAVSEILEVTSQGSHAFEVYIEKDMQILSKVVKNLSKEKSKDEAAIRHVVEVFEDDFVSFDVMNEDDRHLYADVDTDRRKLSEDELAVYKTGSGKGIREPFIDEATGQQIIGGYQEFAFADGVRGIVQVKRKLSVVEEEFILTFYDQAGYSYITNGDGDILVHSSKQSSKSPFSNILTMLAESGNDQGQIQEFHDRMKLGQEEAGRFNLDGEETVLAFTSIKGSDGWSLVAVVPDAVIMKHGEEILNSSRTFMVLFGSVFAVTVMIIYMGRISYRKILQKEEDVQHRERLCSILANSTNDVYVMFTTDDYSVEYVSPNIERLFGIKEDEVKGDIRMLNRVFSDNKAEDIYDSIKGLAVGESITYEGERVNKLDGEHRWFLETVYKTQANGSTRFVAVLSDRTHEQQSKKMLMDALEIAKSANESKSVFLSNMSHDIRTPMNAIVGFSTLLQRDAHDPDRVYEYTRKISSSSQHLLGLINDVLDMSKIESGKTTLNISEISLAEVVDELGAMMQVQAKAKHQDFRIYVYDVCNEEILGDRLRINQILINILSNAVKYTPDGGKIEMSVRQLPQHTKNYARFRFVIKDNGIGMSEEYLETIFQPFSRESSKKTAGIQGTGLGMAITKNLIDLMGGTISVESELDHGSTFTLVLELRIKEQNVDPEFWIKHGVTHLLVVDDEEEICLGVQKTMTGTGVNIQYALGGQEAVAMAEGAEADGRGFDLVIIDWQMPDISGIETARRIRKIVPSNVPIMILTAYDISSIEEEGTKAGVDGFLQKPFFLSNFKMIVDSMKGTGEEAQSKFGPDDEEITLEGMHILAAEDIELNAEILMELLKIAGATCEWAGNGQEALEMFEQSEPGHYDLILMDVQMPVMNGYDATRAIRGCSHPQAETVPIIAMTANTFSEDVKDALDAGMNAHVGKPVDMNLLKAVIKGVTGSD
ncbi:MAG: response regulator [Eubacterium sp.]|nr:response regulator [Eubacterium sp.]MCI8917352.1 response regulator [Eubacterium sp.]